MTRGAKRRVGGPLGRSGAGPREPRYRRTHGPWRARTYGHRGPEHQPPITAEHRRSTGRGGRVTGRSAPAVLPPSLRGWLGPIAALAALVVVVLGVLYADDSKPGMVDARMAAVDGVGPPWRHIALALDFLGEPVGAATLVVVIVTGCLLLRCPRAAVLLVAGVGMTVGMVTPLKSLVGRTIHDGNLSYPSGHTAFLTALALVVALHRPARPRQAGRHATGARRGAGRLRRHGLGAGRPGRALPDRRPRRLVHRAGGDTGDRVAGRPDGRPAGRPGGRRRSAGASLTSRHLTPSGGIRASRVVRPAEGVGSPASSAFRYTAHAWATTSTV